MAISRAQLLKELLPGLNALFGLEPAVNVGQEVVDCVAFRDRAVVLQRIDIVVGRANTQRRFQQTSSNEHQRRRDDQLLGLGGDQQSTLISPRCDLNHSIFQRGFVQVRSSRRTIAVGATAC